MHGQVRDLCYLPYTVCDTYCGSYSQAAQGDAWGRSPVGAERHLVVKATL